MSRASTLNVSLTPALRRFVMQKVKSGGYESASEVVRESLRLLRMVDQRHAMEGIVQEIAKEKRSKSR